MNGWEEFCLIDLESMVTPEILERGTVYFQDGHVLKTIRLGSVLAGVVAGTGSNYKVRLWLEDGIVHAECSCFYQGFCKHLAALALVWLELPGNFKDVEPQLHCILQNPELTEETLVRLCRKDPFGLDDLSEMPSKTGFHSARGILNLVRNAFCYRQVSLQDSVALWENVERIRELLAEELLRSEVGGLIPLGELVKGISETYLEYPSENLMATFEKTAILISELPPLFPASDLRSLFDLLLELYFNSKLWEWSDALRRVLSSLNRNDPHYLAERLERVEFEERPTLELISIAELLKEPDSSMKRFEGMLSRVEGELSNRPQGRLWLIDRYGEENPEYAFRLAREGMRQAESEVKSALRERLIKLHCGRHEFKQAASLSFIQFREKPNIEEYLRLKEILLHHRQEWEKYYCRAIALLREKADDRDNGCQLLLLRILLDEGEYQKFSDYFAEQPTDTEGVFDIVDSWPGEMEWEAASIFPQIIEELLAVDSLTTWRKALKAMIRYKKCCFQTQHIGEWKEFCRRMNERFYDERRFHRRFGAILTVPDDWVD